jgi:hypothetical protein
MSSQDPPFLKLTKTELKQMITDADDQLTRDPENKNGCGLEWQWQKQNAEAELERREKVLVELAKVSITKQNSNSTANVLFHSALSYQHSMQCIAEFL